ncbi:MAG: YchJ family protein [Acidimicrobiales bacterium]
MLGKPDRLLSQRNEPGHAEGPGHCFCGSGNPLGVCCTPIIDGKPARTAERLMRSRFTAFCLQNPEYLLHSWHPSTRPSRVTFAADHHWTRLEIRSVTGGDLLDSSGTVDFVAHFVDINGAGSQGEVSKFVRLDGRWVYVDGIQHRS